MSVVKYKNIETGEWVTVNTIVGPPGKDGEPGTPGTSITSIVLDENMSDESKSIFTVANSDNNDLSFTVHHKGIAGPFYDAIVGDGVTNDSAAIQALLDNFDYVHLPPGLYRVRDLTINRDHTTFICDGTLVSLAQGDQAVLHLKASHCHVKIAHMRGAWAGSYNDVDRWMFKCNGVKIGSNDTHVLYNYVEVGYIEKLIQGFWFAPDGGFGVAHNTFKFGKIIAGKGIYFNPGDTGTNYINGNYFWCGQAAGNYALYTQKGANQIDPFNGNVFYHLAMEGCYFPITCDFFCNNHFKDTRISRPENSIESPNPMIHFGEDSAFNAFETFSFLFAEQIEDLPKTVTDGNYRIMGNTYEGIIVCTDVSGKKTYTKRAKTNDGYVIVENESRAVRNATNTDLDMSTEMHAVNDMIVYCKATTAQVTITLSPGFRSWGATRFYLHIDEIDSASYGVSVVQDGVTIVPASELSEVGVYRIELIRGVGWTVTKHGPVVLDEANLPEFNQ